MNLPKVSVDPMVIQSELESYFDVFLSETGKNGHTFSEPVKIIFDEENDTKIFFTGFFKNRNEFSNENSDSIYFIYYDGCDCPHLIEEPGNRYTISEIRKCSLHHLWLAYNQCQTEFTNNN